MSRKENIKPVSASDSVSRDDLWWLGQGGRQTNKFAVSLAPLKQRSVRKQKIEEGSMEKEMAGSGKMYFEDLPKHVQDVLLDLIVSIIKNMKAEEAGLIPSSDPGTNSRKRKGLPRIKRAPSR
jgi:hypothetical protein